MHIPRGTSEYVKYMKFFTKEHHMAVIDPDFPRPDNIACCAPEEPNTPEAAGKHFFIIWNPRAPMPPRVRFETLKNAQRIAEQMAQRHGEPFYVLKAISLAQRSAPPVETKKLK